MPLVGFESTISAGESPWTYALDHVATGTSTNCFRVLKLHTVTDLGKICKFNEDNILNGVE
jgi:hypothetical protein